MTTDHGCLVLGLHVPTPWEEGGGENNCPFAISVYRSDLGFDFWHRRLNGLREPTPHFMGEDDALAHAQGLVSGRYDRVISFAVVVRRSKEKWAPGTPPETVLHVVRSRGMRKPSLWHIPPPVHGEQESEVPVAEDMYCHFRCEVWQDRFPWWPEEEETVRKAIDGLLGPSPLNRTDAAPDGDSAPGCTCPGSFYDLDVLYMYSGDCSPPADAIRGIRDTCPVCSKNGPCRWCDPYDKGPGSAPGSPSGSCGG